MGKPQKKPIRLFGFRLSDLIANTYNDIRPSGGRTNKANLAGPDGLGKCEAQISKLETSSKFE